MCKLEYWEPIVKPIMAICYQR